MALVSTTFAEVPSPPDTDLRPGRKTAVWLVTVAIAIPLIYALVVDFGAIDEPPAWDSAITVSPAALTMVDLDFDIWELAHLPSSPRGGPSTHATSLYTISLAVLIAIFGPATAFAISHVTSIALVGALAGVTYLLARERASVPVSALVAVTVGIMPVVVQQAADVYLDLPLAVVATLACRQAARRRFLSTSALVFLGVAIKTSGVFLLPLILFARPKEKSIARHLAHSAIAGGVALIPFVVVFLTTHRFSTGITPADALPLIRSSAALLILTVDVFVILSFFALVMYGRARGGRLDRVSRVAMIAVASFFAVHVATMLLSGTIAILPRYYIVLLPVVLSALAPVEPEAAEARSPSYRLGVALIGALALFSIINVQGNYYPRPDDDFYVVAERSTRAQDLLALHVLGTRKLVASGLPILAERQVHFRLEYPGMGYVDERPDDFVSVFIDYPETLPDRFVMLIERRFTNPLESIEQMALDEGYTLSYEEMSVGGFTSQLVTATR